MSIHHIKLCISGILPPALALILQPALALALALTRSIMEDSVNNVAHPNIRPNAAT